MLKYTAGTDVGVLQDWPFDNPASHYRIVAGTPRASGRLDAGGTDQPTRLGIWRCTKGIFECTEQGDELMTILSGRCRVTNHSVGATQTLSAGDTLFVKDGSRVTWEVIQDVTKVFFGHKPGGFD